VQQNGRALQYASTELKNDREIVMAAVNQNGYLYQYASEALKNDREVVHSCKSKRTFPFARFK
jgi:hypothetical protein